MDDVTKRAPGQKRPAVLIDGDKFAEALDRLVKEPALRERLEKNPAAALDELGFQIEDRARAEMAGKKLSQYLRESQAQPAGRAMAVPRMSDLPETAVRIGVEIAIKEIWPF